MNEAITIALITSLIPLIGTIITVLVSAAKTDEKIKINLAIFETKMEELTREVRSHNNFAQRMPVVEEQVKHLSEKIKRMEDDSK